MQPRNSTHLSKILHFDYELLCGSHGDIEILSNISHNTNNSWQRSYHCDEIFNYSFFLFNS